MLVHRTEPGGSFSPRYIVYRYVAYLDPCSASSLRLSSTGDVPIPEAEGGGEAPIMSSEASARNPELLAEEAAAKFVNEGGCVCSVVLRHPPLHRISPLRKPAFPAL